MKSKGYDRRSDEHKTCPTPPPHHTPPFPQPQTFHAQLFLSNLPVVMDAMKQLSKNLQSNTLCEWERYGEKHWKITVTLCKLLWSRKRTFCGVYLGIY